MVDRRSFGGNMSYRTLSKQTSQAFLLPTLSPWAAVFWNTWHWMVAVSKAWEDLPAERQQENGDLSPTMQGTEFSTYESQEVSPSQLKLQMRTQTVITSVQPGETLSREPS